VSLPDGLAPRGIVEKPDGGVWLIGGMRGDQLTKEVWVYKDGNVTQERESMQIARNGFSTNVLGDKAIIAGGRNDAEARCNGTNETNPGDRGLYKCPIEVYPNEGTADNNWQLFGSYWHVGTQVRLKNGKIAILYAGGYTNGRKAEVFRNDRHP